MRCVIDQPEPLIVAYNKDYLIKMLEWRNQPTTKVGDVLKFNGFAEYNWLVDINSIFSSRPAGIPIDRTKSTQTALNFDISRTWNPPTESYTLEQAMSERVKRLSASGDMINLYWSGGIDSTAMVTAFLIHSLNYSQLRIFYSPYSVYEHPEYLNFLKKFQNLTLIDFSGATYIDVKFDGIFLTGDGGDELMASIDESFFETHGRMLLDQPWQDLFFKKFPNDQFIDFCCRYFSLSNRSIDTVLEARWFFYAMCKNCYQLVRKIDLFSHHYDFEPSRLMGFFDCDEFEKYIYWNLDQIIPGTQYRDWKLPCKQYCANFDNFQDWAKYKQKINSSQAQIYSQKKQILENSRSIFYLSDGYKVTTPNLPFLSSGEFQNKYGNRLDYLFNEPG